jgi:hypothetical protein
MKARKYKHGGEVEAYNPETMEMALTQVNAMADKLKRIKKHMTVDVDAWVASKITLADDYLTAVADYLQYEEDES